MAAVKDLRSFVRGDHVLRQFWWQNPAGQVIPLTGRTFRAQIRRTPGASSKWDFSVFVDVAAGSVLLTMTTVVSSTLPSGLLYWDLEQTYEGKPLTILTGRVMVVPEVTR